MANIGAVEARELRRRPSLWITLVRFVRKKPLGAASATLLIALSVVAVFAKQLAPYEFGEQFYQFPLNSPNTQFLLGTDQLGRDVLSRLIHGARVSLYVGFVTVIVGVSIGVTIGVVSAFLGGKADLAIQRVMDAIMVFPFIVKAIVIVAVLGPGINNVIIAISIAQMPRANRIVRGVVLAVKEYQYIDAAYAIGASSLRIMFRHILPNIFAPIAIIASVDLGAVITTEATLSFLGLGIPPPFPSWGGMLTIDARPFLERAWWLALAPGLSISLTVLSFNLLGDALRDVLDPRLRS